MVTVGAIVKLARAIEPSLPFSPHAVAALAGAADTTRRRVTIAAGNTTNARNACRRAALLTRDRGMFSPAWSDQYDPLTRMLQSSPITVTDLTLNDTYQCSVDAQTGGAFREALASSPAKA